MSVQNTLRSAKGLQGGQGGRQRTGGETEPARASGRRHPDRASFRPQAAGHGEGRRGAARREGGGASAVRGFDAGTDAGGGRDAADGADLPGADDPTKG